MNREQLYQAIGDIDDLYIEEALLTHPRQSKSKKIMAFSALAASFLLVVSLNFMMINNGTLIFNQIEVVNAKEVPLDLTGYVQHGLTLEEVDDYLAVFTIPETLANLPLLVNASVLIKDDGEIVHDRFEFVYGGQGTKQILLSTATREVSKKALFRVGDASMSSMIEHYEVKLGIVNNPMKREEIYYAEFEVNNVFVTVKSRGIAKQEFLDMLDVILSVD